MHYKFYRLHVHMYIYMHLKSELCVALIEPYNVLVQISVI